MTNQINYKRGTDGSDRRSILQKYNFDVFVSMIDQGLMICFFICHLPDKQLEHAH